MQNQGFEQALSPSWTANGTATQSTQHVHGGTHSLLLAQNGQATQTVTGAIPNTNYSVSAWCYEPSSGNSASLTVGSGSAVAFTTSGAWTSFSASGNSNASGNILVTLAGGSASGNQAWCDDLTMSTVNQSMPTLTWGQAFGFDGFGNLLSETPSAGSAPNLSVAVSTATNQITGSGAQYDANGNLINNGSTTFSFDLMGRMKTAGTYSYTYSAGENKRVAVYNSASPLMVFYLYGPDGKRLGTYQAVKNGTCWSCQSTTLQTFQYLGGKVLNYGEDRLSSNGNRYYPYGQAYSGTAPAAEMPAFGTYVPDGGSGMMYADQRYYNAPWGRFLTPDPSDKNIDPTNPTSWNRYMFVNGDTANGTDPTGEDIICTAPDGQGLAANCYDTLDDPVFVVDVTSVSDPVTGVPAPVLNYGTPPDALDPTIAGQTGGASNSQGAGSGAPSGGENRARHVLERGSQRQCIELYQGRYLA